MKIFNAVIVALSCVASWVAAPTDASAGIDSEATSIAHFSQYRALDLPRFEHAFTISLRHEVPGVVESSLRDVVLIKLAQPGAGCKDIVRQIEALEVDGRTPAIRYKAALAREVFRNPDLFVMTDFDRFRTDADVFTYISRRLEVVHLVHDG